MFRKSSAQGYSFVLLIVYFDKQEFTDGPFGEPGFRNCRDSAISAARGEGALPRALASTLNGHLWML